MKTEFVFLMFLALTVSTAAQVKPKPKPTPVATAIPAAKPEPTPTQKVIVEKINGDRLTGLFVTASTEKITINISNAKIDIPFSEIASIRVNESSSSTVSATTPSVAKGVLRFRAAVVTLGGNVIPVARGNFSLLTEDLRVLLAARVAEKIKAGNLMNPYMLSQSQEFDSNKAPYRHNCYN